MPTLQYESLAEFIRRHGGEPLQTGGGSLLLPDGAMTDDHGMIRQEAPTDTIERLRLKHRYVKALLERDCERFELSKQHLMEQANCFKLGAGPPPEPELIADLRSQVPKIEMLRLSLKNLERRLTKQPDTSAAKVSAQQQQYMERQSLAAQIQTEIRGIEI